MNLFRFLGDMSHVYSFLILFARLQTAKSAVGISRKTQELYLLVFVARYLDVVGVYLSAYLTGMKVFFLLASLAIVLLLRYGRAFQRTYDAHDDSFLHVKCLIVPCLAISYVSNAAWAEPHAYNFFMEWMWTFSLFLESVAIVPQLVVLQKHPSLADLMRRFMLALGTYRGLYILNWIYRYSTEGFWSPHAFLAGVLQTLVYADHFTLQLLPKLFQRFSGVLLAPLADLGLDPALRAAKLKTFPIEVSCQDSAAPTVLPNTLLLARHPVRVLAA